MRRNKKEKKKANPVKVLLKGKSSCSTNSQKQLVIYGERSKFQTTMAMPKSHITGSSYIIDTSYSRDMNVHQKQHPYDSIAVVSLCRAQNHPNCLILPFDHTYMRYLCRIWYPQQEEIKFLRGQFHSPSKFPDICFKCLPCKNQNQELFHNNLHLQVQVLLS